MYHLKEMALKRYVNDNNNIPVVLIQKPSIATVLSNDDTRKE
jgi:hypothetical protein